MKDGVFALKITLLYIPLARLSARVNSETDTMDANLLAARDDLRHLFQLCLMQILFRYRVKVNQGFKLFKRSGFLPA